MPDPERLLETPPTWASEPFDCAIRFAGRAAAWLQLSGELDLAAVPRLSATLKKALTSACLLVVVDLGELTFIDCAGLRVLLAAADRARSSERRLILVRAPKPVRRLVQLAGCGDRLELTDLDSVVYGLSEPAEPQTGERS